jgi:hypothetical protein
MRFRSHQSWFPKEVDLPNDYEDASARSEKTGRAVIADGVSSAIFSRTWARLLTRTAVANPPSVTDDVGLMQWVGDLQKLWREGINFKGLPWNLKPKATSTGAQATLLLIEIEPSSFTAGAEADSQPAEYRLQAHALGDCNLFLIRNGEKLLSFPMADSAAFAAPPDVFSSIAKNVAYAGKFQHLDDRCREGDLLVACTDAIGLWAMQEYEAGKQVDWMRYWGNDEAWQADIQHHRGLPAGTPGRMRIDDCTLLLLQVVAETTDESELDVQPDRSDEPFMLHGAEQPAADADKADATEQVVGNGETLPEKAGESANGAEPEETLAASEPTPPSETAAVEKGAQEIGPLEIAARDTEPAGDAADAAPLPIAVPSMSGISEAPQDESQAEQPPATGTAAPACIAPSAPAGMETQTMAERRDEPASPTPGHRTKSWFSRLFPN